MSLLYIFSPNNDVDDFNISTYLLRCNMLIQVHYQ